MLVLPNLRHPFEIKIDTLEYFMVARITQVGHPMAFHLETFSETIHKYSTYEREMLVIVQALKHWIHYIIGK